MYHIVSLEPGNPLFGADLGSKKVVKIVSFCTATFGAHCTYNVALHLVHGKCGLDTSNLSLYSSPGPLTRREFRPMPMPSAGLRVSSEHRKRAAGRSPHSDLFDMM